MKTCKHRSLCVYAITHSACRSSSGCKKGPPLTSHHPSNLPSHILPVHPNGMSKGYEQGYPDRQPACDLFFFCHSPASPPHLDFAPPSIHLFQHLEKPWHTYNAPRWRQKDGGRFASGLDPRPTENINLTPSKKKGFSNINLREEGESGALYTLVGL